MIPVVLYGDAASQVFACEILPRIASPNQPQGKTSCKARGDKGVMTSTIVTDPFLQKVLETSTQTREQCTQLIDFAEANAVSASHTTPPEVQLELSKRQKLLYSYLAQLRGLNRNAILQVRGTKQGTAEARQEIDRLHLQLQNLYYEERHLRGEIAACESYECV